MDQNLILFFKTNNLLIFLIRSTFSLILKDEVVIFYFYISIIRSIIKFKTKSIIMEKNLS